MYLKSEDAIFFDNFFLNILKPTSEFEFVNFSRYELNSRVVMPVWKETSLLTNGIF